MSVSRYSFEQIFCGLRIYWQDCVGSLPIEPAMRIDDALRAEGLLEEIDLADVYDGLQQFFGFAWDRRAWSQHFRLDREMTFEEFEADVAPHFTFSALAEFVRERVEAVPMGPIVMLGRTCATAGAFRGIEDLVRRIDCSVPRFAPSTRIGERLAGATARSVHQRLRWISAGRLPASPQHTGDRWLFAVLAVLFIVGTLVSAAGVCGVVVLGVIAAPFLIIAGAALSGAFLKANASPFAGEFVTFGDLARFLAHEPTTSSPS